MRLALFSLALFAAPCTVLADIVPRDGIWTNRLVEGRIADECGAEARPMLEPMLAAMGQESETELTWGGSFDPRGAMGRDMSDDDGVTWTQVDPNTWRSEMKMNPDDPRPAVTVTMEAIAPDRIDARFEMDFEMLSDGEATDLAGNPIDAAGCVLIGESTMTHGG